MLRSLALSLACVSAFHAPIRLPVHPSVRAPAPLLSLEGRQQNELRVARFLARTHARTEAARAAAREAQPRVGKFMQARKALGTAFRRVTFRREPAPAVGGGGGAHRRAGRWPPPPLPPIATAPWPSVKSWYDRGVRLKPPPPRAPPRPPLRSWYDEGIRLTPPAPPRPALPAQPPPTPPAALAPSSPPAPLS